MAARPLPRLVDGADPELRQALPVGICRTFRVLPYGVRDGHVLVAAADARDEVAERVVGERLERPVTLVRHTVAEVNEAIDAAYPAAPDPEPPEDRRARLQIAQMLTRSRLVTTEQLQAALLEYSRTGDPLGEILVSHGAITEDVLVAALSEMHQLQRVGLADYEPDWTVARRLPEPLARTLQALPVAETEGELLLAVARPLGDEDAARVADALGQPFRQLLANRADLARLIQRIHSSVYTEAAVRDLREQHPELSAGAVLTGAQRAVLMAGAVVVAVAAVNWPVATVTVATALVAVLYAAVAAHRLRSASVALTRDLGMAVSAEEVAALDERTLPTYTVLVPLHGEADVVPRLVADLDALDYPRPRLDIKLLCEEDDTETVAAVRRLALPPHVELVVIPDGQPKTKPKACSYGLQLARGEFCVVFDAEDRPDPDQLKKALVSFERSPGDVGCVQARLSLRNAHQNLLTAWTAAEHAAQFELQLPATGAAGAPVPLGRTSHHVRTRVLREVGAWDPFDVAQDGGLGIRLHRSGYRTVLLDSTTSEEATPRVADWVRQRSRWHKGTVQTWLVHVRRPVDLLRQTGVAGFLSFNLTMATVLVLLLDPVLWVLTTAWTLAELTGTGTGLPAPVPQAAALMLLLANGVVTYLGVAGALRRGDFALVRAALLAPVYWALMSLAAWRGLLQLVTNPFYWDKTEHGLDEVGS